MNESFKQNLLKKIKKLENCNKVLIAFMTLSLIVCASAAVILLMLMSITFFSQILFDVTLTAWIATSLAIVVIKPSERLSKNRQELKTLHMLKQSLETHLDSKQFDNVFKLEEVNALKEKINNEEEKINIIPIEDRFFNEKEGKVKTK